MGMRMRSVNGPSSPQFTAAAGQHCVSTPFPRYATAIHVTLDPHDVMRAPTLAEGEINTTAMRKGCDGDPKQKTAKIDRIISDISFSCIL